MVIIHINFISDIAEEERLLSDFVVTGTKLVSVIEEIVSDTERLSCIAGKATYCLSCPMYIYSQRSYLKTTMSWYLCKCSVTDFRNVKPRTILVWSTVN